MSSTLKEMWNQAFEFQNSSSYFDDKTLSLNHFNDAILKTPGSFRQALNKNHFMDVKCPLGCWEHSDYCQLIQFHHFINETFFFYDAL